MPFVPSSPPEMEDLFHVNSDGLTCRERRDAGQANVLPSLSKRLSLPWPQPFHKDHFPAPSFGHCDTSYSLLTAATC